MTVQLSDDANRIVIADAVRISPVTLPEVRVKDGDRNLVSGAAEVNLGAAGAGAGTLDRVLTIENLGGRPLRLGEPLLPVGFQIVGSVPELVPIGGSVTLTVGLYRSQPGVYYGTLRLPADDLDENPFEIVLRGTVLPAVAIVDNGDSAYYKTSGFGSYGGQGYQGDVDADNPRGGDTATWKFTGLPAGTYRVSATYTPDSDRATLAPYSVNGGPVLPVNQKLAPSDPLAGPLGTSVNDSGTWFTDLSVTANPIDGVITVTLSEATVGKVIADAVRIEPLGTLRGGPSPSNAAAGPRLMALSTEQLDETVERAIDYWMTVDARAAATLRDVQVAVTHLPANLLGLASFETPTIWLDDDAAGQGWTGFAAASDVHHHTPDQGFDLLTVITHEFGHVLGHADLEPDHYPGHIMSAMLAAGENRVPRDVAHAIGHGNWPETVSDLVSWSPARRLPIRPAGLPRPLTTFAEALTVAHAVVDGYFSRSWSEPLQEIGRLKLDDEDLNDPWTPFDEDR